jgi:hypothetical protein
MQQGRRGLLVDIISEGYTGGDRNKIRTVMSTEAVLGAAKVLGQ